MAKEKRARRSQIDRISALPDGVRELVLSFLPARDAVRTTVLARRWRDVWMRSNVLRMQFSWARPLVTDHLTWLELTGVRIGDGFFDLSGCPALVELRQGLHFLWSPSLQRLSIIDGYFSGNYDHCITISLSSLTSLTWIQCGGWTPLLEPMPSLTTAVVILRRQVGGTIWPDDYIDKGTLLYALSEAAGAVL